MRPAAKNEERRVKMKKGKLIAALALSAAVIFANIYIVEESQASGSAYIVIDAADNKVLMESNAQARLPMASTTKVMTALIVLENAPTDLLVTVLPDFPKVFHIFRRFGGHSLNILFSLHLNSSLAYIN